MAFRSDVLALKVARAAKKAKKKERAPSELRRQIGLAAKKPIEPAELKARAKPRLIIKRVRGSPVNGFEANVSFPTRISLA